MSKFLKINYLQYTKNVRGSRYIFSDITKLENLELYSNIVETCARAMIYYDSKVGLSEQQSLDGLELVFGDKTPSRATVFRWIVNLKED